MAYSTRYAFYEWSNWSLLLLLAWIIATEVASDATRVLDRLLLLWGLGCGLYIFKTAVTYLSILKFGGQPHPAEFIIGFDNHRFFNHVQTVSLPLLGLLVLRSGQGGAWVGHTARYWWTLTAAWWMLLFVSSGRGTFLGILAGVIMVLIWRRRQALPWCRVMLLSCIAGFGAYIVFYILVPHLIGLQPFGFLTEVVQRSVTNLDSSRWPLWLSAWEMIVSHPWLGVGPLHFAHYSRDVQIAAHPHNWVLQIASEWGIPALFCLNTMLFMSLRKLLRTARSIAIDDLKNQAMLTVWLATGVAIVVDGFVSGLIVMPTSQLWITLYIGCAWGWASTFPDARRAKTNKLSAGVRIGLMAVVVLLIYFVMNGLFPEVLDLPSHNIKNLQDQIHPGASLKPRLWGAGYF